MVACGQHKVRGATCGSGSSCGGGSVSSSNNRSSTQHGVTAGASAGLTGAEPYDPESPSFVRVDLSSDKKKKGSFRLKRPTVHGGDLGVAMRSAAILARAKRQGRFMIDPRKAKSAPSRLVRIATECLAYAARYHLAVRCRLILACVLDRSSA